MSEKTFEYKDRQLTVLELAKIILPESDQVSAPLFPLSSPLIRGEASPKASGPVSGSGRVSDHDQSNQTESKVSGPLTMTDREAFCDLECITT